MSETTETRLMNLERDMKFMQICLSSLFETHQRDTRNLDAEIDGIRKKLESKEAGK